MKSSTKPQSIFISYRRADKLLALALFQRFHPEFDVFLDERPYDFSTRLDPFIINQIQSRTYFMMLVTPSALHESYFNNLFWREAEVAIQSKRLFIPLVTNTTEWHFHRQYLVNNLAMLARLDGIPISCTQMDSTINDLKMCLHDIYPPSKQALYPLSAVEHDIMQGRIAKIASHPLVTVEQLHMIAYYEQAYAHYRMRQYDRALTNYGEAIRINPYFADVYLGRSRLLGNDVNTLSDLNQAIHLDPHFADAFNERGDYHRLRKDYPRAIADYTEAIRINPHYATYYTNRANCHLHASDDEHASADFNVAVTLEDGEFGYLNTDLVSPFLPNSMAWMDF
jgi:tetratricopeptide (TPR) repeat protein